MATPAAQQPAHPVESYIYRFDLQNGQPHPLELFSSTDLNAGEKAFLDRYQFKPMPGGSEMWSYFNSTFCNFQYLAIAKIEPYSFYFYVRDDESLMAFKRRYEAAGTMLPRMILPPGPQPIDMNATRFTMDVKKAFWG